MTQEELDWLYSRKSVVKTHIANVLVKRGLAENNLDAMKKYLDGCKSGDTRFSGEEAINAILNSGGRRGDMIVKVTVEMPKASSAEEKDLYLKNQI